jgi:hypothetical protein
MLTVACVETLFVLPGWLASAFFYPKIVLKEGPLFSVYNGGISAFAEHLFY